MKFPGGMNIQQMMKQAQAMQEKLQAAQAKLAETVVEGVSGGGMCRVTLDEGLLQPGEAEIVSDLIVAAHADAKRKLDETQAQLMREAAGPLAAGMGGGMPGFPGMKF